MIISIDAGKTLVIKGLSTVGIEGNFLSPVKGICENPTVNILFSGDRLLLFPFDQGQSKAIFHPFYSLLHWRS